LQATWTQQNFNLLSFAGHKPIDQLVGSSELQPMAGETHAIHSKAMAAVFRLINIAWCPGPFQENNVSRAMEGKAQTPCSESGKKKIAVPPLKTIDSKLTLRRTLTTNQQFATQPLLQQLKRFDESTEEHHRLTAIKQFSKQLNCSRELELGCDATKSGEQSQRFGIGSHLPQGSPATVILKD